MNFLPLRNLSTKLPIFSFFIYPFLNLAFHKNHSSWRYFTFDGKSPFLIKRLIVEIEIPINLETSLMLKNNDFESS